MRKALVVEDEDGIIPAIKDALVARGDDFDRAKSLEEARKMLQGNNYAYVLLDLKIPARDCGAFPDMSYGVALLKEIRQTKSKELMPVIAMTSHHSDGFGIAAELYSHGVNACISKPFDEKRPMVRVLEEVLSQAKAAPHRTEGRPLERPKNPQPFKRGEMVFSPKYVTLCGVSVLGDTGLGHGRRMLNLLRRKRKDGRFVRITAEEIARRIGKEVHAAVGVGTITGCAKTIRTNINKRLLRDLNLVCDNQDVLVRDEQGYHLNDDKIAVRDSKKDEDSDVPPNIPSNVPGDKNVPSIDPDVPSNVPANVPSNDPANMKGLNERQMWVVEETRKDHTVQRSRVEEKFRVSEKTAKRDFAELVKMGLVDYVRKPHPGFYRRKD